MGFSLRLGCWSPLSGYLAFYMSLFSVAARLPYLNRSAGKIGVNRILFTGYYLQRSYPSEYKRDRTNAFITISIEV